MLGYVHTACPILGRLVCCLEREGIALKVNICFAQFPEDRIDMKNLSDFLHDRIGSLEILDARKKPITNQQQ